MKPKRIICAAVFLVLFLAHSAVNSQVKQSESHLIYVLEVRVKTSKIEAFEKAVRALIGLFKEHEFPRSVVGDITDNFLYFFSTPLASYGDVDILFKDLGEIEKRMDEDRSQTLRNSFKDTYESIRSAVIFKRPDLSYVPINPRLPLLEARYMRMDAFYIKAGHEDEFENFCKTLVELWRQKNVSEPFSVYAGQIGTENPVYYLSTTGKDPADYWSHVGRIWNHEENEFKNLWKTILPFFRKWEFNTGWLRLDLTYWP